MGGADRLSLGDSFVTYSIKNIISYLTTFLKHFKHNKFITLTLNLVQRLFLTKTHYLADARQNRKGLVN